MKVIAHIYTDFPSKFGIPRQSRLADTIGLIVFEKEYQNIDALKGIEDFSHIWLLWEFSEAKDKPWSPTVRPPRLGGNKRMGVFATRSPYRPNPIGLSCVKLLGVENTENGIALKVSGADLMNGTPIYDIKPYLAFTDSIPDAKGGFADERTGDFLEVFCPEELKQKFPEEKLEALISVLSQDPRPHYIEDGDRIFGFSFAGYEIKFKVLNGCAYVTDIIIL